MNLVLLHGAPATGKYTVARELAALTGAELYHNHLVVDKVLERHAFGTPGFVAERDRLWRDFFTHQPGPGRENIVFTFNPESTVPQAFVDWLFAEMPRRGVRLHSIELTASEAAIENRLGSEQRRQFRKLTDLELYRRLRDSRAFATPVMPRTDLEIDTARSAPTESAARIAAHFRLR